MKHSWKIARTMALAVLVLAMCAVGCKNSNTVVDSSSITVSEDDAADVIAASLGGETSTQGFSAQVAQAARAATADSVGSDASFRKTTATEDTATVVRQKTGLYSYDYVFRYSWTLVSGVSLSFQYSMRGKYETPRLASDDSAHAVWMVTGLGASSEYILNGTYLRLGSEGLKVRAKPSLTTTLSLHAVAVSVNKATGAITAGTGTFTFSGKTSGGRSFAYTGTISFLGNQLALLMLNGRQYDVNLTLGEAASS